METPRFLLTAGASGSGKTLITCGILQALKNRGLNPASFKCGPDYIDPGMEHRIDLLKGDTLDRAYRRFFHPTVCTEAPEIMRSDKILRRPLHGFRMQRFSVQIQKPPLKHMLSAIHCKPVSISLPDCVQTAVKPLGNRNRLPHFNILRKIMIHQVLQFFRIIYPGKTHIRRLSFGVNTRIRSPCAVNARRKIRFRGMCPRKS